MQRPDESEVGQVRGTFLTQQDIGGFDVMVDDPVCVNVIEG